MNNLPIISQRYGTINIHSNVPQPNHATRSVSPANPFRATRLSDTAIPVEHFTFQNPIHRATMEPAKRPSRVSNGNNRQTRVNKMRQQANRHTFAPVTLRRLPHWQGSRHLIPGPRSVMASRKRTRRKRKTRKTRKTQKH
jgi:hypothetical protein